MTRINRRSFLAEMRSLLAFMEANDRERVLRFYEKLFDQAGEEGEGALLKKLGSPVRQVLQVERVYRDKQKENELNFADAPVKTATPAVEETVDEAEEEPAPTVQEDSFVVPAEENAVDFSAEEEAEEELPAAVVEEPVETEEEAVEEETAETAEETAEEETVEAMEEAEEEPALPVASDVAVEEETDEAVTEVVAPPDEEPEETVMPEESESADETAEEDSTEAEEEQKEPVGAGRVVAAVFVTIPVILMVVLGFVLSLSLGFSAMGVGVACGAAGCYLSGYAFGGMTAFLPDILLLSGSMLLCFCLALFFLWLGIWLAVGGIRLTIRVVAAIYRGILKRGGQSHE